MDLEQVRSFSRVFIEYFEPLFAFREDLEAQGKCTGREDLFLNVVKIILNIFREDNSR